MTKKFQNRTVVNGNNLTKRFNWVEQVNYTVQKVWKALHFIMCVLKKGNRNTKCLAYTSFVRPILEYAGIHAEKDG